MIHGRGGTGKTTLIKSVFPVSSSLWLGGHITPMAFFDTLAQNPNATIVLDDCDSLIHNKDITGYLKCALIPDTPIICASSKHQRDPINFTGRIVILCNHVPNTPDFRAVASRCLSYDFCPSNEELSRFVKSWDNHDTEGLEYLNGLYGEHFHFSLRDYQRCCDFKKDGTDWKELYKGISGRSDIAWKVAELMQKGFAKTEAVKSVSMEEDVSERQVWRGIR